MQTILIIDNSIAITGALKAIVSATRSLQKDFRFVYVLPEQSTTALYVRNYGFDVEFLPFVEISRRPKDLLRYVPFLCLNGYRLKKIIRKHEVSIVHVNDFYNLAGIAALMMGSRARLVTHTRFLPQKFMPALAKIWTKLNLRFADKIICVSDAVRQYFPVHKKVVTIPDPLPEKEWHPEKRMPDDTPQEIRLLYLSNYIRGKGQEYALVAFREAYKLDPRLRLEFVGGDMGLEKNKAFKLELERQTRHNNLESVIRFTPFVADVEQKIKDADILLNFSESESFSLTCMDALYYGTPLIASDCGGPAELFENHKSGLLVPNRNVTAMTEAILKLSNNLNLLQMFSQEGKIYVRKKFSAENTFLRLKGVYMNL